MRGFVHFHDSATGTKDADAVIGHRFADTVRHEPSALERDAQGPVNLVAADALLTGRHQVNGLQPKMQSDVAVFKDRAHADGELGAAIAALLEAVALDTFRVPGAGLGTDAVQDVGRGNATALRADRTIRPKHRLDMGKRGCFIVHIFGGQDRHGGFLALYREGKPTDVVCQV